MTEPNENIGATKYSVTDGMNMELRQRKVRYSEEELQNRAFPNCRLRLI